MKETPGKPEAKLKRAPTLYGIIAFKLLKGLLFVAIAVMLYRISDNDLPGEFKDWMRIIRADPEKKFWSDLALQVDSLTEKRVVLVSAGTLIYSLFSLVEGVGLIFRVPWAGWLAIGESAFFIPIEVYELLHRRQMNHQFSIHVVVILVLNIIILLYLLRNRERLFRH